MISVITVCFNSANTIRKTFESMLAQTYQDFEYIIVDGGSTDGTVDIIEEYLPRFSGKMSYRSEKDSGIYDAMNKGIARCHGELIGIVNSDDWYEPETLATVAEAYAGEKYEIVYGMLRTFREGKEYAIYFNHHDFLDINIIPHPTCFITRAAYMDLGVYDTEHYRSSSDYELLLRYFHSGKVTFTPVYKILSNFVLGGMSSSNLGVKETAKLKRSLGLMSAKKYWITVTKATLSDLIGNTWESK